MKQPRSTQRYKLKQPEKDRPLIEAMREVVDARPRLGCDRVHSELLKLGWSAGFGRVHRLWKQESMQVPKKQRKRRRLQGSGGSHNSCVRHKAMRRNHVWSYDFVTDRTEDGRQPKLLVVLEVVSVKLRTFIEAISEGWFGGLGRSERSERRA
ncbi:MAG: IS3 family transposase, partial [Planctomycetota bacterium]